MIQDIAQFMDITYDSVQPQLHDTCLVFKDESLFIKKIGNEIVLPTYGMLSTKINHTVYLFTVGDTAYFLAYGERINLYGYAYEVVRSLRYAQPKTTVFAIMTGFHLYTWYRNNKYCGRCGKELIHDEALRALSCTCGNQVFPRISPAIIVAVTHGDRILLTKYKGRPYTNYALIAGFVEIGETLEETVRREVMEEAGIHVRKIRYYKSQPWGIDSNLLMGFFAQLEGSPEITVDENELLTAQWVHRKDIDVSSDGISLTSEMIQFFKDTIM